MINYGKIALLLIAISSSFLLQAQGITISGTVTDSQTSETIPGAHVYLSGTTIGATSDESGFYTFTTNLKGNHILVSSFIGYTRSQESILITGNDDINRSFELNPSNIELEEIRVVASNTRWKEQLKQFTTFFIGFDDFAKYTDILNPEVLSFNWNEARNEFKVTTPVPLKIQNNALGYKAEVELVDVRFNPDENTGSYKIYPRITELLPTKRRYERRWNRNRSESFEGSSRHFFKSLYHGRMYENKFRPDIDESKLFVEVEDVFLINTLYPKNWQFISSNYKAFRLLKTDFVIYDANRSDLSEEDRYSSFIVNNRNRIFFVNENGLIYNSGDISFLGGWNNDRFSDFLPQDYTD